MKTLQNWLAEQEKLCEALKVDIYGPDDETWRAIRAVSRMARSLPQALKILRLIESQMQAMLEAFDARECQWVREVLAKAEQIINEEQPS